MGIFTRKSKEIHTISEEEYYLNKNLDAAWSVIETVLRMQGTKYYPESRILHDSLVLHVLTSKKYEEKSQSVAGMLEIMSYILDFRNKKINEEEIAIGSVFLCDMKNSPHYDKSGKESETIKSIIIKNVNQLMSVNIKTRQDIFTAVLVEFTKLKLNKDAISKYENILRKIKGEN